MSEDDPRGGVPPEDFHENLNNRNIRGLEIIVKEQIIELNKVRSDLENQKRQTMQLSQTVLQLQQQVSLMRAQLLGGGATSAD